ncbi:MAG: zinc ribbon domain-containing protein, partial [Solobacterium sp.]|nr:zinc ribbon domain-containing protein [Solobacterium sp.]
MANFCMKCGARLQPDSRFCMQCGTPVPDLSKGVRITEDGKGGLKIEAPEGSTVKISDPVPPAEKKKTRSRTAKKPEIKKPETPPAQKKSSGKGPAKGLIVLLAAALGFTAFVKPGFLLDKDKPDYESTTISSRPGGSTVTAKPQSETPRDLSEEVPAFTEDVGTSREINADPAAGVHVHADAGAFDQDTEIIFTPADESDPAVIAADEMLKEEGLYAVAAWEVNAGLADDEQMPGQYDVTIDLDTLDIDPVFYDSLQVVRVNEAGEYYAYRTQREGNTLRYSSNQNSLAFVCIISGAVLIFAELEYIQRNKYYIQRAGALKNDVSATDFFKRQVLKLQGSNDYASWVIEWRMDDIDPALADKVARIAQIQAAAQAEAEEYRKTLGIFSRLRENYHVEEYYRQELEGNAEYKRLLKELEMPEIIEYINECIDLSFKYLAEQ